VTVAVTAMTVTDTVTVAHQGAEIFTPVGFSLLTFDSDYISPKRPSRLRICTRPKPEVDDDMNKWIIWKFNAER